jgi:hypothetical protein
MAFSVAVGLHPMHAMPVDARHSPENTTTGTNTFAPIRRWMRYSSPTAASMLGGRIFRHSRPATGTEYGFRQPSETCAVAVREVESAGPSRARKGCSAQKYQKYSTTTPPPPLHLGLGTKNRENSLTMTENSLKASPALPVFLAPESSDATARIGLFFCRLVKH